METIIRAPSMSSQPRQLKRSLGHAQPLPGAGAAPAMEKQAADLNVQGEVRHSSPPSQQPVPDPSMQLRHLQALDDARSRAEREGFAAGLEKGEEAARKAVSEQVARLASIVTSLDQARFNIVSEAEDAIVEVVYAAVCRIVGETAATRDGVIAMINQVLASFRERDQLVVNLHPQDLALIQRSFAALEVAPIDPQVRLRADPAVKCGGCIVESAAGSLDARLDTQLSRLCEVLSQVRRSIEKDGETI